MVSSSKPILRSAMRRLLADLSPADRATLSLQLTTHLTGSPLWRDASSVALFASLPDEPDTTHLEQAARHAGKMVLHPRLDDWKMLFRPLDGPAMPGSLGIPEPPAGPPVLPALVIVPGLAFDIQGYRLGRGKGCYDRWLASHDVPAIGVGFAFQVLESIPTEPHDMRLTAVFTDQGSAFQTPGCA